MSRTAQVPSVWLDAYELDNRGEPLHAMIVPLHYHCPAGLNGDFFQWASHLPPPHIASVSLGFRIYVEDGGRLFTDGMIHQNPLAPVTTPAGSVHRAEPRSTNPDRRSWGSP